MRQLGITLLILFCSFSSFSQTIPLGSPVVEDYLRRQQLLGKFDSTFSFNFRPINFGKDRMRADSSVFDVDSYFGPKQSFLKGKGVFRLLPAEFKLNYDSHHPTGRNDGAMIRARGAQTLISAGVYVELGPLSIQLKPEVVYAQNREFDGFPVGFDDEKWSQRYIWWNRMDLPERYGNSTYSKLLPGQSSIRLNKWGLSLGISSENLWWGPSMRNSVMMSNNAQGFEHITFNTTRPQKTPIGNFEWQIVSATLEASGFRPPDTTRMDRGRLIYRPKVEDSRYYQAMTVSYSPKWIPTLSLGFTRWVQMYSEFAKSTNDYFPIFSNFFRENDGLRDEIQRDQAAGLTARWRWPDSKAEIYAEFHRNDASGNFRDLILDSDHSRATTIGLHKLFDTKRKDTFIQFKWEWTEMAQTGSAYLRGAGSWYIHSVVRHGYTHNGEVLGSGIGPGSNSHYMSVAWTRGINRIGGAIERVAQNNDFVRFAFSNSIDWRRYWADYNIHAFVDWKFEKVMMSANLNYSRSLNYQWELFHVPFTQPYLVPGTDVGNLNLDIKLAYLF